MLDLFLAKVTLVSDSFMLSAQFPLIDKKNARNDKFSSLNARWNSRLFCASHSYNKRYKTCWPSRKQQLKEAKFWLYSKRNSEHKIKLNASYVWWKEVWLYCSHYAKSHTPVNKISDNISVERPRDSVDNRSNWCKWPKAGQQTSNRKWYRGRDQNTNLVSMGWVWSWTPHFMGKRTHTELV